MLGANLLLDESGETVKITDFGVTVMLAHPSQSTRTNEFAGQNAGSLPFMAPEVYNGEDFGRASDVWSFGCCIVEMLTGKPPWASQIETKGLLAAQVVIAAKVKFSFPKPDCLYV